MRVLYFSAGYGPHDHRFLSALADTKHEVLFLQLEAPTRMVEDRPVPPGVRQVAWAGGRGPFQWRDTLRLRRDLRRVIKETRPDLIHAGPIQTCAFLAVLSGFSPILTMSWGFDLMQDADRNAWWRWVTGFTLRRSSFFVSDARVTRSRAIVLGMQPERTSVFAWGVDLRRFRPGATSDAGIGAGGRTKSHIQGEKEARRQPFVIFCNRSWEPRYGVDVLARAFVLAARHDPRLSLILLGGGSESGRIRRILMDGDVLDRTQFGGQISQRDLPRWYNMADLFVSPSHIDGSSVSLMEALACGRPVLVSDIPANKEWVTDGINGWLFRDGDAADLSEKLLNISSGQSLFRRVGRAARKVAEARADWSKNFQVLMRAYDQAVTAR